MRQSTLSQILRVFKKDVLPTLGRRSICDINRHDVMHLLSQIVPAQRYLFAHRRYATLAACLFLFPFILKDAALVLGNQVQGAAYFKFSLFDRATQQSLNLLQSIHQRVAVNA